MVDFDHDDLVSKADGRFRFVSLIQRRMRDLQRGMPPLVEQRDSFIESAIAEFREGRIWLATGEDAEKLRSEHTAQLQAPPTPAAPAKALPPAAPRPGE